MGSQLYDLPDQYSAPTKRFHSERQLQRHQQTNGSSRPGETLGVEPASDLEWLRIVSDGHRSDGVFHPEVASRRLDLAVRYPLQELVVHLLLLCSVSRDKSREENKRRLCAALLWRETMSSWHAAYVYIQALLLHFSA